MFPRQNVSYSTVDKALSRMRQGIKPTYDFSKKFSMDDISQAWRRASIKVFGGTPSHE